MNNYFYSGLTYFPSKGIHVTIIPAVWDTDCP